MDYVAASFVVRQHIRHKYACRRCQEGVCIADLPAFPIDKGRPGSGLLAHVLTSKYADHLPLHRMEGILARHGMDLQRSTLCDWVGACSELLRPIVAEIHRQILSSAKIHTDDTPVPVQIRGRKKTRKGYLWAYIGQDNNVHSTANCDVVKQGKNSVAPTRKWCYSVVANTSGDKNGSNGNSQMPEDREQATIR